MSLSRDEILSRIDRGIGVVFNGRVLRRRSEVPSATELAGDDPLLKQAAVKDLEAQKERILAEIEAAKKLAGETPDVQADESTSDKSIPEPPGVDVKPAKAKAAKGASTPSGKDAQ